MANGVSNAATNLTETVNAQEAGRPLRDRICFCLIIKEKMLWRKNAPVENVTQATSITSLLLMRLVESFGLNIGCL